MINDHSLTTDWISAISRKKKTDPVLTEKVIRALWMLEGLSESNLPFTFKGGTALMLKMGSTKRLSIDIDIVVPKFTENLEELLIKVANERGFGKLEEQKRNSKSTIPKTHYKFYYKPLMQRTEQTYVLLDIIFGESGYHKIEEMKLDSSFLFLTETPSTIQVPSFEDLAGDKLTAFAPETTGIPYTKNEQSASMEIIKQLYDLGNLFDRINEFHIVAKTFDTIARSEINHRQMDKTPHDVLNDSFDAALSLSSHGNLGNANFKELVSGVKRLQPYIFSERYTIDKAICHAARIAYVTRLLAFNQWQVTRFMNPEQVRHLSIVDPSMTKLNKLKKVNAEAFYYWLKAIELDTRP